MDVKESRAKLSCDKQIHQYDTIKAASDSICFQPRLSLPVVEHGGPATTVVTEIVQAQFKLDNLGTC